MCLYPKLIQNRKYIKNKKNGGVIPAIRDNRVTAVPIGCGKCIECRKQKSREWQVRLLEDIRHNKNGIFVTLTFSNESITEIIKEIDLETYRGYELDNKIAKIAVRRMCERWRKEHKKSVRHWLVTELGHNGTENIHLHGIIWTDEGMKQIKKHWKYGYVYPRTETEERHNYVSERTINYITKYISKQDDKHKEYKSVILTSAGIGRGYIEREDSKINKYKLNGTKETYTTRTGHEISMPIYWRNKLYNDDEREKLWLEKLDKGERWICGEKIDIKQGEEEYYELLEYYRKKNERLGYGNNTQDWNRKKYEEERREMMMRKRWIQADTQGWPAEPAIPWGLGASSAGMEEV